jgi:PAS domain S-box-containing protein
MKEVKGKTTDLKKLSSGDVQSLVHELEVHQIELEMQNEELRRVQHELEEARNRYSDLYDFAPIGYFTFDKNGSILEVNLTGAKKLGRERGNLIKKPFSLYIHGNKDIFSSHIREVFNTETQMICELRLVDNKGNIYDAQLESMPVHDSDGNLLARTAMSDITGRKRVEEMLRKVLDELEIRVKERTAELVEANMALQAEIKERKRAETRIQHLNNMLGAIRNVNQLITREKDKERLVQESCILLVENRGWQLAWILLVGKDQRYITAASAGADEQFLFLVEQMKRGNYPRCVRDTLIQGQPFIVCDDVRKQHKDCVLINCLAGEGAFTARLEHEGKVYGTITVGVLPELVLDREEQSLFQELVTDLSYALAGIESEEERQRAEDSLKLFRSLIEQSNDAIEVINPETGCLLDANERAFTNLGYTREEFLSLKVSDIDPIVDESMFSKIVEKVRKSGSTTIETRHRRKDGSNFPVEVNIKYVCLDRDYLVTVARDITERKRAEEIQRENEYLTYASKVKSDFLANMSHELRSPLNAVIGFSELLKMKTAGELNEKQQQYVSDILTSGKHLLYLINDILDLSKVEAGKIDLVIEKVHVPQAINEGLTLVKENAMKDKISLKVELDHELGFVEVDKHRLKQILFNLLSNAVKFSKPEGGTVTVKTRKEGDMAQISVSDTGIGIREEDMGKLFKEFEQISAGTTKKYGGTGLGLSISKKLVELHGGTIMAESEFGRGSTFTFLLPLKARKEENE